MNWVEILGLAVAAGGFLFQQWRASGSRRAEFVGDRLERAAKLAFDVAEAAAASGLIPDTPAAKIAAWNAHAQRYLRSFGIEPSPEQWDAAELVRDQLAIAQKLERRARHLTAREARAAWDAYLRANGPSHKLSFEAK